MIRREVLISLRAVGFFHNEMKNFILIEAGIEPGHSQKKTNTGKIQNSSLGGEEP